MFEHISLPILNQDLHQMNDRHPKKEDSKPVPVPVRPGSFPFCKNFIDAAKRGKVSLEPPSVK